MDTTREMHEHAMETTMKDWGARLDALRGKADKASADAKVELRKQLQELDKLDESARKHLAEFKASSKDTWQDMKKDLETRWNAMTSAFETYWKTIKN